MIRQPVRRVGVSLVAGALLTAADPAPRPLHAAQACTLLPITALRGDGFSQATSLSADGRFVAFDSAATDLVLSDGNGFLDVFVYDRQTCTMEMISVDPAGNEGNGGSFGASISDDGRYVAFSSFANTLVTGDTNGLRDVFLRDRTLGTTQRVSVTSSETQVLAVSTDVVVSGNGLFVAFRSFAIGLVPGDTNAEDDIFVRDVVAGTTERASVGTGGVQGESVSDDGVDDIAPAISNDGRYVAFATRQHNFVLNDNNVSFDVFLRDRQTDTTTLVSVTTSGGVGVINSSSPAISGDGRYVAFATANPSMVADDTNGAHDIFVRDTVTNITTRASLANQGGQANDASIEPALSDDGRYVAFGSLATNLVSGDSNVERDVFVHDRTTGVTRRVSAAANGVQGDGESRRASISGNGLVVAFESFAGNLVTPDLNGVLDGFVTQWGLVSAPPDQDLIRNGSFDSGTSSWLLFATPDSSYMVSAVVGGVFEFHRLPPPSGSNQAVIFQRTTGQLQPFARIEASFSLGNTSTVRKRISVLIQDADFSDLFVCTFILEPNAPLRTYTMVTHTTKNWADATIAFYAASAGANGGNYQLDNVSLRYQATGPTDETLCGDPTAPAPPGGAPSGNLLTNGDFGAGLPPWGTFGQISFQIAAGVFEFIRLAGTPAGVVLQNTNQPMAQRDIITATFDLGNSSSARKRVTVLIHEGDFTDLVACTFWLPPATPLQTYTIRLFATKIWGNATFSLYGATVGPDQWIRLDNASVQRTPAQSIGGTECYEPGALPLAPGARASAARGVGTARGPRVSAQPSAAPLSGGTSPLATSAGVVLWVPPSDRPSLVQMSVDGFAWETLAIIEPSDDWIRVDVETGTAKGLFLRIARGVGR